jgi:RimJ/RimL family protein N-acetyltransferase
MEDLPIFFVHQRDQEAARLAAFTSRDESAFMTHWTTKILGNPAAVSRTILLGDRVAGNIGAWTNAISNERQIGYWIGREYWGQGVASAAVAQFVRFEAHRPLGARVAKHNHGSIRVLEKAGFVRVGAQEFRLPDGTLLEELIYSLTA